MTFTLIAVDREAGMLGAATASRSLAVGNAVIAIDPAVGVAASQAWTNRALRHRVLRALHDGLRPDDALALVPEWDERPDLRQVAAIDLHGTTAAMTGAATSGWSGHIRGAGLVALGNLLAGPAVLDAMVTRFETSGSGGGPLAFARRLVSALSAGEGAGGDVRGRQSAALLVAEAQPAGPVPSQTAIDLRVDDHEDPVSELSRLVDVFAAGR